MNFVSCIFVYTKKNSQEKTKQQKESTQNERISLYSFYSFQKIKFGMLPTHNLKTNKLLNRTTLSLTKEKHHNTPTQLQKPIISVCHVEIPALNEDNVYKIQGWEFFKKHNMKRIYRVPAKFLQNSCALVPNRLRATASLPVDVTARPAATEYSYAVDRSCYVFLG